MRHHNYITSKNKARQQEKACHGRFRTIQNYTQFSGEDYVWRTALRNLLPALARNRIIETRRLQQETHWLVRRWLAPDP
jgi:hypothetical protein